MRLLKHVVCVLFGWLAVAGNADAQVNIERLRGDAWPSGFSGNVSLDFSLRTGNVDIWEFGVGGRANYGWPKVQTFVLGNGDLGWQDGTRFSNAGLLHWRTIYRLRDRVLPEGFVQINYDKSRLLDFRGLLGGGLRLGLIYSDPVKLWWGTAYMLERERYSLKPGDSHPDRVWANRWSNYLSVNAAFNKRTGLGGAIYVQPRIDGMGDFRVLGDFRLGVDLSQRVDLVVTLYVRYDSRPPLTIVKRDVKLKTGISIKV